jgi:hypothetical protein
VVPPPHPRQLRRKGANTGAAYIELTPFCSRVLCWQTSLWHVMPCTQVGARRQQRGCWRKLSWRAPHHWVGVGVCVHEESSAAPQAEPQTAAQDRR